MRVNIVGETPQKWSPHAEIWNAIRALPTGRPQMLLGYGPAAKMNPYQSLLYQGFGAQSVATPSLYDVDHFEALLDYRSIVDVVGLHLHWLHFATKSAGNPAEARRQGDAVADRLAAFKERGGKLVWTVHNAYPHDAKFVEEELALQQRVADLADVVHLMSPGTLTMLDGLTSIDEAKVVVAPHPSYVGAYEDVLDKTRARAMLGLSHDDLVWVGFGAMKPYKGLRELREAFEVAIRQPGGERLKLVLAGGADKSPEATDFVAWATTHPQVLIHPKPIDAAQTQVFLRAADWGLAAYRRNLNSGAALLYLTFGLPVLAVDTPVLRESLPEVCTTFVADIDDVDAYAQALGKVPAIDAEEVYASVDHLAPETVSTRFAGELRERLLSR